MLYALCVCVVLLKYREKVNTLNKMKRHQFFCNRICSLYVCYYDLYNEKREIERMICSNVFSIIQLLEIIEKTSLLLAHKNTTIKN